MLCVVGTTVMAQVFEAFWNRTAIESAEAARSELATQQARNASLLENASEGVMVVAATGIVKFASPAAERLLDVAPGASKGHRLREFTAPAEFERTASIWSELLAESGAVRHVRLRTLPRPGATDAHDGRILDVVASNQLANAAVAGVVVRMRDVTELAQAQSNYENLVEHSLQGIAVYLEDRFVYANAALAKLFGVERDVLLERSHTDGLRWVHEDDREASIRATLYDDDEPCELRVRSAKGEWRWLRLRSFPTTWEGRAARQVVYADATMERALQEQREHERGRMERILAERTLALEASQRRLRDQERMVTVGTLAAGIAHQINNPVGAILTTADFALLTADECDVPAGQRDALEDIREQAIRCGKIVRSVLQFARAEPTEKWHGDATTVVRTAVEVTAGYAAERGARVELQLAAEASTRSVLMNPIELEQVFVNLIRKRDRGPTDRRPRTDLDPVSPPTTRSTSWWRTTGRASPPRSPPSSSIPSTRRDCTKAARDSGSRSRTASWSTTVADSGSSRPLRRIPTSRCPDRARASTSRFRRSRRRRWRR